VAVGDGHVRKRQGCPRVHPMTDVLLLPSSRNEVPAVDARIQPYDLLGGAVMLTGMGPQLNATSRHNQRRIQSRLGAAIRGTRHDDAEGVHRLRRCCA